MAKRPDLSSSQRKIVDRYYQHRDTIWATKLSELVGEIAIAHGEALAADRGGDAPTRDAAEKKLTKLWKSAADYLAKCGATPPTVERIAGQRDTKRLADAAGAVMMGKPVPVFVG
jgi:hypothetical protein